MEVRKGSKEAVGQRRALACPGEMGTQAGVWCLDPRSPYLASYDLSPQTAQLPHCVIGAGGNRAQKEAREKGERTTKSLALELHQRLAS